MQVSAFLGREEGKDFKLISEEKLMPSKTGHDGFYIALMEKKNK